MNETKNNTEKIFLTFHFFSHPKEYWIKIEN